MSQAFVRKKTQEISRVASLVSKEVSTEFQTVLRFAKMLNATIKSQRY